MKFCASSKSNPAADRAPHGVVAAGMGGPSQPPSSPPATAAAPGDGLIPVAAYVRMSTEHQQYSTENQLDRIKEYAARRGMVIIEVFTEAGKSGLSVKGRESLQRMIATVEAGEAKFKCILAYDVSRWGRFQDADESGYYEYICKRAGITVHYCAEQFENDGSPTSNIIKSVKRSMAGEYSRELSTKVFQGACRLIQMGFKQGGAAGFGLRRMLIDSAGKPKGTLKLGEQKSLQTDRVVYVPGPDEEQAVVREIYARFLDGGKNEREIADILNGRNILTDFGRAWTRSTVHQILTNEKYIGNNVYHRTSFKLKRKQMLTIKRALGPHSLLIVDEAARAFQARSSGGQKFKTLEFIREIHDATGCGVVLCGTRVFRESMESAQHRKFLNQFNRRCLFRKQLPDVPTRGDLNAFARHYGLEPAEGEARRMQGVIVGDHGLGVWLTTLMAAARKAANARRAMTWADVLRAHAFFTRLEQTPADEADAA